MWIHSQSSNMIQCYLPSYLFKRFEKLIFSQQQKSGDWQVTQSHKSDEYNMMTSPRTTTESSLPTFTTATPTTPETTTTSSTKFTTKKKKVATGTIIFG